MGLYVQCIELGQPKSCSGGSLRLQGKAYSAGTACRTIPSSVHAAQEKCPEEISAWEHHEACCCEAAGLLGFPSKDLQYRFLSRFVSVFYVRQRDYSKVQLFWVIYEHAVLCLHFMFHVRMPCQL